MARKRRDTGPMIETTRPRAVKAQFRLSLSLLCSYSHSNFSL